MHLALYSKSLGFLLRMGGRAVEGTGLENRQAGDRLVGSNPTPSAISLQDHGSTAAISSLLYGFFSVFTFSNAPLK